MKKGILYFLALICVVYFGYATASAQDITGSIMQSVFGATGDMSFKLRNVLIDAPEAGLEGKYWVDFLWDPVNYVLNPVAYDREPVRPPAESLRGTYILNGYYVKYSNGRVFTDDDVGVTGTMRVGSDEATQVITLEGYPTVTLTGSYSVTYVKGSTDGILAIRDFSGSHEAYFWLNGYDLTTFSGIMSLGEGITYREWDFWYKVDDSPSADVSSQSALPDQEYGPNDFSISGGIGRLLSDH